MAGVGPVDPVGPAAPTAPSEPNAGQRGARSAEARVAVGGSTAAGREASSVLRRVIAAPLGSDLWQLTDGDRLQAPGHAVRLGPGAVLRISADAAGRLLLSAIGATRLAQPVEVHLLPPAARPPDDAVSLRRGHPVDLAWPGAAEESDLPRRAVLQLDPPGGRTTPTAGPDRMLARAAVVGTDSRGTLVDVLLDAGPRRALIPGVRLAPGGTVTLSWSAAATVSAGSHLEPAAGPDASPTAPRSGGAVSDAAAAAGDGSRSQVARAGDHTSLPSTRNETAATGSSDASADPPAVAGRPSGGSDATGAAPPRLAPGAARPSGPPLLTPGGPAERPSATVPSGPGEQPRTATGMPPAARGASASGPVTRVGAGDTAEPAQPSTNGPGAGPPAAAVAARLVDRPAAARSTASADIARLVAAAPGEPEDATLEPVEAVTTARPRVAVAGRDAAGGDATGTAPDGVFAARGREVTAPGAAPGERREASHPPDPGDAAPPSAARGETPATARMAAEAVPTPLPPPAATPDRAPETDADDDTAANERGAPGPASAHRARFRLQLASLGAVDLAAFCPDGRLDLTLRVDRHLPPAIRREIEAIHAAALAASGRTGRLTLADGVHETGPPDPAPSHHRLDTIA
jgi:hypothetical protein